MSDRMTRIHVTFTAKELSMLSNLASDQLFHREFIDTRLTGYKSNSVDLSLGKALVVRLRSLLDRAAGTRASLRIAG